MFSRAPRPPAARVPPPPGRGPVRADLSRVPPRALPPDTPVFAFWWRGGRVLVRVGRVERVRARRPADATQVDAAYAERGHAASLPPAPTAPPRRPAPARVWHAASDGRGGLRACPHPVVASDGDGVTYVASCRGGDVLARLERAALERRGSAAGTCVAEVVPGLLLQTATLFHAQDPLASSAGRGAR